MSELIAKADKDATIDQAETQPKIRLRLYYDFEKPRNGRELIIPVHHVNQAAVNRDGENKQSYASVGDIKSALSSEVDIGAHQPHVYDGAVECFVPLEQWKSHVIPAETNLTPNDPIIYGRIDVKLISSHHQPQRDTEHVMSDLANRMTCNSSTTSLTSNWFGIGILRGKASANHGTLWRSALQFGCSMTFTIGQRYQRKIEACSDVYKTLRQIPCIPFPDVAAFMATSPVDAKIVAVEYGGDDLISFVHPKRALYVLGSEDAGLPPSLVARAHAHISIPTADGRPDSLNVASAGAIIMYDRFMKQHLSKKESDLELTGEDGKNTEINSRQEQVIDE